MGQLQEFLDYLGEQADNHGIYVWGAQGQGSGTVTEAWIRKKEKNTGGYTNGQTYADAAVAYWKKQCALGYGDVLRAFDCSGLGVYWLYNCKRLFSGDKNANGMMAACRIVDFSARKKGCWLFRVNSAGRATHIGYMVDDTNVVHAKGRAYGVVREVAKASYWHRCGIPAVFADEIAAGSPGADGSGEADNIDPPYVLTLGKVNVRRMAGTENPVLYVASKGEKLPFGEFDDDTGWYGVETPKGAGFISNNKKYTKLVES